MARDALRSVLRKSGSDSPTDAPERGFSFYDNNTEDPLSHVTIAEQKESSSKENSSEFPNAKTKNIVKSNSLSAKKSMTPEPATNSNEKYNRPEEIFSDSEILVDGKTSVKLRSSKSSGKDHKRSRSDMSWLKTTVKPPRKHSGDIGGATEEDSGNNMKIY